jgi:hypothetical protein
MDPNLLPIISQIVCSDPVVIGLGIGATLLAIPACKGVGLFTEILCLRSITKPVKGKVAIHPKALIIPLYYRTASGVVQQAMMKTKKCYRWDVFTVPFKDPLTNSVRVKGLCKLTPFFNHSFSSRTQQFVVEIEIDIDTTKEGSKITWRYTAQDTQQLTFRLQMLDPELHLLLADTNRALLQNLAQVSGTYKAVSL